MTCPTATERNPNSLELEHLCNKKWPQLSGKSREGRDLASWMISLFQVLSKDDLSLYIRILYDLWQERNAASRGEPVRSEERRVGKECSW